MRLHTRDVGELGSLLRSIFEAQTSEEAFECVERVRRASVRYRRGERTVEDLRAIPWVFSWMQSRCIITGWYALATGIDAYLRGNEDGDGGGIDVLREMYDE